METERAGALALQISRPGAARSFQTRSGGERVSPEWGWPCVAGSWPWGGDSGYSQETPGYNPGLMTWGWRPAICCSLLTHTQPHLKQPASSQDPCSSLSKVRRGFLALISAVISPVSGTSLSDSLPLLTALNLIGTGCC